MKYIRHLNILPPTLLLAATVLLSRVLGLFRDHLLAKTFGASAGTGIYDLDVYYAAFRIPDLIYNLLVFGVVSAAFIPIFTRYKKERDFGNAWAFASGMTHLMLISVGIISAVFYFLAPYLAHLVAGGFTEDQLALTAQLMRALLLSPILFSMTAVLVSIQDSFKTFLFRSIGPLFYNLGIIGGIIFLGKEFGVAGVTFGVIAGAVMQLLIQLPSLKIVNYKHVWTFGHKRPDVRRAFKLILPRILGLSLTQLTMLANTFIASFLVTGSITVFYLAENLYTVPLGMIAAAFSITSFATLSELAAEPAAERFGNEIKRVMQRMLFLILPATVGMFILREEIISMLLLYGKFSASDAMVTADTLKFLLLGLFAHSLIMILSRGFYAYEDTKTPVLASLAGAALSIGGALLLALVLGFGVSGIALAYSMGMVLTFFLLFLFLRKKTGQSLLDIIDILKMIGASFSMGLAVLLAMLVVSFDGSAWLKIGQLVFYVSVGILSYFSFAILLRIPERKMVTEYF